MPKFEKNLIFATLIVFIPTIAFIDGYLLSQLTPKQKPTEAIYSPQIAEVKPISLIFVGDIMLDRGVEYMIEKKGNGDFKFPFLKITDELKKADILFGNLEGPISDKGTKVGSIYSFRADPKVIEGLTFAGFDILSVANNHAFDYGRLALEDTFLRLKEAGIDYVGGGFSNSIFQPLIKETNGVKIAFLAFTNLCPDSWKATETKSGIDCVSKRDFENIKNIIQETKKSVDILIISLHSGEEYVLEPNQFQMEFSEMIIDSGADLVIGHHPHVVQKNEKYNNGLIFYSLGNFVFDQGFSEKTMQ